MHLNDSLLGIILAESGGAHVVYVLLFAGFFSQLPYEIEEAAIIDGAGFVRIFAQLILPLSGPVIATTVILQFMSSWNNFFLPLVLTLSRPELRTLGVGMFAFQGQYYVVRRRCEAFFHEHLGTTEVEFVQLFAGSSPATSEPIMRMDELARTVSITPVLVAELADKSEPWKQPGLSAVLAVYFEAFGHRASDWEYIGPTLAERPDRAIELLREAVARVAANQPSAVETARQRRDTSVAALRRKLPNAPLRASFDRLLKDAQATFAIHEDNINLYMTACGVMRYALLEAGARLVQRGLLADAERVFFLRRGELECALSGDPPSDLEARTAVRWSDYQQQLHHDPPQTLVIVGHGDSAPAPAPAPPPEPERGDPFALLKGLGASPGIYTGRARVIVGEEQFEEVQAGEVLVCPQTSPSGTILFRRIGALVTDDGGILSHPAIAAREFGLPAVVSTSSGTRLLATGQLIEVDGSVGTVRVVDARR